MNKIHFLLVAFFAIGFATVAHAAENASARAILILASPEKKASDPRLSAYVETLRRLVPGNMASFQAAGEGSASVGIPGRSTLSLDKGHRLEIEAERSDSNRVRLNVRWFNGDSVLLDQPVAAQRGKPTVLGGPKAGGNDVWAVLLIVE